MWPYKTANNYEQINCNQDLKNLSSSVWPYKLNFQDRLVAQNGQIPFKQSGVHTSLSMFETNLTRLYNTLEPIKLTLLITSDYA